MDILSILLGILLLIVLAFIIANAGSKREIGYGWSLFLGLTLSPIVSLIAVLLSDRIQPDENGQIKKNWGCVDPLIATAVIIISLILLYCYVKSRP